VRVVHDAADLLGEPKCSEALGISKSARTVVFVGCHADKAEDTQRDIAGVFRRQVRLQTNSYQEPMRLRCMGAGLPAMPMYDFLHDSQP
jgi:hypothetical protein